MAFDSIPTLPATQFRELIRNSDPRLHADLFARRSSRDLELFARLAFGHLLPLPFAAVHRRLFRWHLQMDGPLPGRRGRRFAIASPRGSAKSTIASLVLVAHDIAHARERFIVLISATQRQAEGRLRALRAELQPRAPLVRWFGPIWESGVAESTRRVLVANGVRVEAHGAGAEIRGVSWGGWRPTKVLLDDAEPSAVATSPRRRQAMHEWFAEVVEHLGSPETHLLAVGTVLHRESLLAALMQRGDFVSRCERAIEEFPAPGPLWDQWRVILSGRREKSPREAARAHFLGHREAMESGSRVIWPEREDIEELMAQLHLGGRRAFWQEKQNAPLGPEDALFRPAEAWRARKENGAWRLTSAAGGDRLVPVRQVRWFGHLDPALGRGRGDFAALASVALAPDETLILGELWVRRAPPSEQAQAALAHHARLRYERFTVEGTGFQELLAGVIEGAAQRGLPALPVTVVRPARPKAERISALEPLLASGRLALAADLPEEFWRELADFPRSLHDDALDAAAGAVEAALAGQRRLGEGENRRPQAISAPPKSGRF